MSNLEQEIPLGMYCQGIYATGFVSVFINNLFLSLLSLSFPLPFTPTVSSKVWKGANNCLRQCLLSPFFSLGPFSLSPHGYLYLRHLAVIDPDVPTRLRKEILAPLSLIFLFMRIHCTLEEMFSFSSLSERDTG